MPELCDYMAWNIENLSAKHANAQIFRSMDVKYWIANLVNDMEANMLGIMEVTLGTGEEALSLIVDELKSLTSDLAWEYESSGRNVDKGHKNARRADQYGVIWHSDQLNIQNNQIADNFGVKFDDRVPLLWQAQSTKDTTFWANFLLWHAPQPKNTLKKKTIKLMADLVNKINQNASLKSNYFICSGDFNVDTGSATAFSPLTSIGFNGIFDGELTTLKSIKSFLNNPSNTMYFIQKKDYDLAFLASAFDNVFLKNLTEQDSLKVLVPYNILKEINGNVQFQIVTRFQVQAAMTNAKIISDHMPLVLTIAY